LKVKFTLIQIGVTEPTFILDAINGDSEQDNHQKKDGTEDKRYKENRRDQDKE